MYTIQTTGTAQGLPARLSILTFRLDKAILGNFRVAKLECVNYFHVQWVNGGGLIAATSKWQKKSCDESE